METISFVKVNTFILNKFQENTIDDFYLGKHPFFYTNEIYLLSINSKSVITCLKDAFSSSEIEFQDKNWLLANWKEILDSEKNFRNKITNTENRIEEIKLEIEKLHTKENEIEIKIQNIKLEIANANGLIEDLPAKEKDNELKIIELQDEIKQLDALKEKQPYKDQIKNIIFQIERIPEEFKQQKVEYENALHTSNLLLLECENEKKKLKLIIRNFNNEIKGEKNNLKELNSNTISFDIELEKIAMNQISSICYHEIVYGDKSCYVGIDRNKYAESLFNTIYSNYDLISNSAWKESLLEIFTMELPVPNVFYCPGYYYLNKVKIANIYDELKISNEKPLILAYSDQLFPVWISLANALKNNTLLKSNSGVFYLNLNNGIYAKIIARRNKSVNENLIVAFVYNEKSFYKTENIFGGYTSSGFILYRGLYINHLDLAFEITFGADALLLHSFNYSQEIQNISDRAKVSDDEYYAALMDD